MRRRLGLGKGVEEKNVGFWRRGGREKGWIQERGWRRRRGWVQERGWKRRRGWVQEMGPVGREEGQVDERGWNSVDKCGRIILTAEIRQT